MFDQPVSTSDTRFEPILMNSLGSPGINSVTLRDLNSWVQTLHYPSIENIDYEIWTASNPPTFQRKEAEGKSAANLCMHSIFQT